MMKEKLEALLRRYFEILEDAGEEEELYKRELITKAQANWAAFEKKQIDFKTWVDNTDWSNLVYPMFVPNFKFLVEKRPEEVEQVIQYFFDEKISLQERILATYKKLIELHDGVKEKKSDNLFLSEREMATILTFRYPDRYTFYLNSVYVELLKILGRKQPKKLYKLPDYYSLLNELLQIDTPLFQKAIEQKKKLLEGADFNQDPSHLLTLQDVLHVTLSGNSSNNQSNNKTMNDAVKRDYWVYSPGANAAQWDEFYDKGIMAIGWEELGDLSQYASKNEIVKKLQKLEDTKSSKKNDATANWEFANVLKPGDVVICKKGRKEFVGYGIVTSEYIYDNSNDEFHSRRNVKWMKKGSWMIEDSQSIAKTLTNVTKYSDYVQNLSELIGIEVDEKPKISSPEPLNIILYGPPGTGKTYSTKAYAISLAKTGKTEGYEELLSEERRDGSLEDFKELRSDGRIDFVTFHQSFTYEDFVQGIRPDVTQEKLAFDRVDGIFKVLSDRARRNYEKSIRTESSPGAAFEDIFSSFISNLVQEEVEEIKVPMRSKGYHFTITSYDPNEGRIKFRKQSGGTGHDLLKKNVKAIYEGQLEYGMEGLGVYYYPLVDKLKEIAQERKKETPPEELKHYVLVIDEINRANISRVLGELITLLEPDKRLGAKDELTIRLPSGEDFTVPPNLHIIGTMNTADKSIAHLDVALRRRFKFVPVYPNIELIKDKHKQTVLKKLNSAIFEEGNPDLCIGHSYFMTSKPITEVMDNNVIPLLMEYFNHRTDQVKRLLEDSGLMVVVTDFGLINCSGYRKDDEED